MRISQDGYKTDMGQGSDEEAAAVFPQLRERILYLTELLWKYPPFCYNDYEKEMRRINILFDERNLLQIRTPDSEFQTEFLRFCVGIIRIPIAMYHFYAAGPTAGGSPHRRPSAPPKRRRRQILDIIHHPRSHGWMKRS